jgi:hypothetical protein
MLAEWIARNFVFHLVEAASYTSCSVLSSYHISLSSLSLSFSFFANLEATLYSEAIEMYARLLCIR